MKKIAVIGDYASVLAFKSLGVEVFIPTNSQDTKKIIDNLAKDDFAIIYITEKLAIEVEDIINKYKDKFIPAIILIPDSNGSLGLGLKSVSSNVERAVGMDIFGK